MSYRALTIEDIAREYGRTVDWMSRNWRNLVGAKKLPVPLLDVGSPTWDAAQVYAYRDKHLPAAMRAVAAAHRAAFDAASSTPDDAIHSDTVVNDKRKLDARFGAGRAAG